MVSLLKVRRPASWLVLLAFLIATLAPSLGMALGASNASRTIWAQLCSVDGPALVAIHVDGDPATKADDSTQGHCLLCFQPSTTPQDPALAPVAGNLFVLRMAAAGTTAAWHSPTWHIPLARAPPVLS